MAISSPTEVNLSTSTNNIQENVMTYLSSLTRSQTPQRERMLDRPEQVKNSAGGFVFKVDDLHRLRRFLILGAEGGTYYANEKKLAKECAETIIRAIKDNPYPVLQEVVRASQGAAPRNTEALFAYALLMAKADHRDAKVRIREEFHNVVRTGSHLLEFATYISDLRGWGKGLRRAVGDWYADKSARDLAYQVSKYRQRGGWTHGDLLRLSHPQLTGDHAGVAKWVLKGIISEELSPDLRDYFQHIGALKVASTKEVVQIIKDHRSVREVIPTEKLAEPKVWKALLKGMPATAMIRNLNHMTRHGVLKPLNDETQYVVDRLTNQEFVHDKRLHPVNILTTMLVYDSGRAVRGDTTWTPVPQITSALDDAFHLSFQNAPKTNKRFYLGIDVSGSMDDNFINGLPNFSARMGAAALAMSIAKREPRCHMATFTNQMTEMKIDAKDTLATVADRMRTHNFGATDCAQPMLDAISKKIPVDVFVILTDGETWAGQMHASEALKEYRKRMGINAKCIAVSLTSTGFSIADPQDAGMLDIVGFDTALPTIMTDFATT